MTKAQLVQEVIDRGFHYIKPTRIGEFIQRAYGEICSRRSWPFLEGKVEDSAPFEPELLGRVLSVQLEADGILLWGATRRWLLRYYSDLEEEGTPQFWYLEGDTLRTFPVGDDTLLIHYLRRPAPLADADEPLIPSEWQYLLVDRAVVDCLKDDDEYEQARALRQDVKDGIREMASALLHRNLQNNCMILPTGGPEDYLG